MAKKAKPFKAFVEKHGELEAKYLRRMMLKVGQVKLDPRCQPRAEVNSDRVQEYATKMESGECFPEIVVFCDGTAYWLADGWHRVLARKLAGLKTIMAKVYAGGMREAILYSVHANHNKHLARTSKDKRRSVHTLLLDKVWVDWSDQQIAKQCHVTTSFVAIQRNDLAQKGHDVIRRERKQRDNGKGQTRQRFSGARASGGSLYRTEAGNALRKIAWEYLMATLDGHSMIDLMPLIDKAREIRDRAKRAA